MEILLETVDLKIRFIKSNIFSVPIEELHVLQIGLKFSHVKGPPLE